ncbi:hypothetical protein [Chryseobacterium populi]|uniref:Uncharacterized protein n=1 Tax=Chryseobacterium populi TaxID=1144316 RepID=J2K6I2_9FLAO|nr:hypothetical protein [Chryseobacterium populi]EJL75825.1 hypothetical protein PMI13_00221 [Chryseobacterium populi]
MKKLYNVLLCITGIGIYAQIGISRDPSNHQPHPDAILDVKSTVPASAVLLPRVPQINSATDPDNDEGFKGAIVYSRNNASIYEHDGTNWQSVYDYVVETKPQYLAHFSRTVSFALPACTSLLGCSDNRAVIPLISNGTSDFTGSLMNLSLASNVVTVNAVGLYRITYRSNAAFGGFNTQVIRLRLQKASAATPTTFTTLDEQSFTNDNDNLGYTTVFNGSIVTQLNAGDKIRLEGSMQAGVSFPVSSTATFQNSSGSNGITELIFEKIVL